MSRKAKARDEHSAWSSHFRVLRSNRLGSSLVRYALTALTLALTTVALWPVRATAGLLNLGFAYLAIIIGATMFAGRRAGIFASALGFLLLDYFLVPPYLTFAISDFRSILALLVFLGVSLLISWLLATAREQAAQAQWRADYATRLYELSHLLGGMRRAEQISAAVTHKVCELFDAESCWILLADQNKILQVSATTPAAAPPLSADQCARSSWAFIHGSPVVAGRETVGNKPGGSEGVLTVVAPLRAGHNTTGVLVLLMRHSSEIFSPALETVLATFADLAGTALERLHLLGEGERAEVLARADELKSALMSAVSHDLRTPLASITASVTSLLEQEISWDEDITRDFLQGIYDEAQHLNRLVGNLLDMSRIQGGAIHPEKDWYSISEVIEGVLGRLEPRLEGYKLHVGVPPDIPLVPLDFTEIDQVLTNLLENVIKYAPPGASIQVMARRLPDSVEVSVQDSGPGVPRLALEHLFDMFYRVDKRSESRGTGLGLAIAKGLVEAHGGTIKAENVAGAIAGNAVSKENAGLKVTFTLPLQELAGATQKTSDVSRLAAEWTPDISSLAGVAADVGPSIDR